MSNNFSENTRVQVPAAMHLVRLGYTYLSYIKDEAYNDKTNVLTDVFKGESDVTQSEHEQCRGTGAS